MGWAVLYIAFGIVALWLLSEVLLQYKARLRWRLLAFVGFVGVVAGVLMPSVVVIALGAIAFAIGQSYVTLSFRRGFSTGWSLKGQQGAKPGGSKRRRAKGGNPPQEPVIEVSELEFAQPSAEDDPVYDPPVYEAQPLPQEEPGYDSYPEAAPAATQVFPQDGGAYAPAAHADDTAAFAGHQQPGYEQYGYGDQQQYAAYSDPYIGTQAYSPQQQAPYDTYGGGQGQQQPGYDQYAGYGTGGYADQGTGGYPQQGYGVDTPPGGVWVPQQRAAESYDEYQHGAYLPPEQAPYQPPYDPTGAPVQGQGGYDGSYGDHQGYRY
ncbi:hypothetical protein [Streptomyces tsukubensis]|uniref:Uncharacterized protein n=1 Tax=Streptomyces tsukubensis TaxID=83656 RepID=A0A1V4A7N1_9ACTN|nr:hypothetical protein [Streptomyces tsukubensis]OON77644.1 hypothetical protein B1H18_18075 [Streptomyces tsukubensis]QFR93151.1 hypothetical protein GBW32_08710 [Streptomyces tsukubensis]